MSDELAFDALELARRANPEIDDMRRMARERREEKVLYEAETIARTEVLRAFRRLARGG